MSMIRINPFSGQIPKVDSTMLPESAAQVAENCRLTGGALESFLDPLEVYDPHQSNIQTIYRFGQNNISDTDTWFTWSKIVDVVKGAIANDTEERTYFTGDAYPRVTNAAMATAASPFPSASYRLGIPAPSAPIVVSVNHAAIPDPTAIADDRYATYTFVTAWGEESAPAPPSLMYSIRNGDSASMIGMETSANGNNNITHKRIYRTNSGSSGTDWQFVDEIPAAQTTYEDIKANSALNEIISTIDSAMLPDLAIGLVAMSNGVMAAHTEYDVYLSESFKPYSYPEKYRQAVNHPIVGLGAFGSSLAILTTGNPYVLTCTDPGSASLDPLAVPYSCVSKRSIVSALGGVIYASTDGLVQISGSAPVVLTDAVMTRREWKAYNPSSMLCAVWDDRIFMFYDNGTKGCLILSGDQGITSSTVHATAAFVDTVTGALYLSVNDKIVKWDAGGNGAYRWKSKRFTVPAPINFSFGQVMAESYPITMKVYADGVLVRTQSVTDDQAFRLPSGMARYWEVELSGSHKIIAAYLANSMEELKNG